MKNKKVTYSPSLFLHLFMKRLRCLFLLLLSTFGFVLHGQDISFSSNAIHLNEAVVLRISMKAVGESAPSFPDFTGLSKGEAWPEEGEPKLIDGVFSRPTVYCQAYFAEEEGELNVESKAIILESKEIKTPTFTLKVKESHPNPPTNAPNYWKVQTVESLPVDKAIFTRLYISKKEVVEGEGFIVSYDLYVHDENTFDVGFYQLDQQLLKSIQLIRPYDCVEKTLSGSKIKESKFKTQGENYRKYTLFAARYYPLRDTILTFPKLALILKEKKEDKDTLIHFYTQRKEVRVHSFADSTITQNIPVGQFQLREAISDNQCKVGALFRYHFTIQGYGNLDFLPQIEVNHPDFEVYLQDQKAYKNNSSYNDYGSKTYFYEIIPKKEGEYHLENLFSMVVYNPNKQKYDTLRSRIPLKVEVQGESSLKAEDIDPIYARIPSESNTFVDSTKDTNQQWIALSIGLLIAMASLYQILRKNKK